MQAIAVHNTKILRISQVLHSLAFTVPIWIVFFQTHLTVQEISLLVAFGYAVQVLTELPTGAIADMFGKKTTIGLGHLLGALAFSAFPFATTFTHFLLLSMLVGISDSLFSGANEAMLYDSLKQDKKEDSYTRVQADIGFWYQIGLCTATLLGGFLFRMLPGLPYFMYGLVLLCGFVVATRFKEPLVDSEVFTLKNYLRQIKYGTLEAFKNSHTQLISLYFVAVGGITWTLALYFNSYMFVALGFGDEARGVIEAVLRLFNIFVLTKVLKNQKLFTQKRTVLFFPLLMMFSMLPGVLLSGWYGIPFIAAGMMSSTARWIILGKYTNQAFTSKYRATAISTLSMLIGIIFIIITGISGPIIAATSVKTMYTLLGLLTIVTVVPLAKMLIKRGKNGAIFA